MSPSSRQYVACSSWCGKAPNCKCQSCGAVEVIYFMSLHRSNIGNNNDKKCVAKSYDNERPCQWLSTMRWQQELDYHSFVEWLLWILLISSIEMIVQEMTVCDKQVKHSGQSTGPPSWKVLECMLCNEIHMDLSTALSNSCITNPMHDVMH